MLLGLCPKIQKGRSTAESVNVASAWLCEVAPTACTSSVDWTASTSSTVQVVWNLPAASATTVHGVCEASVLGRPSVCVTCKVTVSPAAKPLPLNTAVAPGA